MIKEDILRACVLDARGSWVCHIPLVDAYNNSYQSSIGMTPFEASIAALVILQFVGVKLVTPYILVLRWFVIQPSKFL